MLIVVSDPVVRQTLGCDYTATGNLDVQAAMTNSCDGTAGMETVTVTWLPLIKPYLGTGGSYEGQTINPTCGGSGTETINWSFSVPPK
jgi:hypothetical protein